MARASYLVSARAMAPVTAAWHSVQEAMGAKRPAFSDAVLQAVTAERMRLWRERVHRLNWELSDYGSEAFVSDALEEVVRVARSNGLLVGVPHAAESEAFADASITAQLQRAADTAASPSYLASESPFVALRDELVPTFRKDVFFWPRQTGP